MLKDLVYAARGLRKAPGFALIAVVTIALGIGASTAIFSVMNGVLLRPLPYRDSDRLAVVWGELRNRNVPNWPFSAPDFNDLFTRDAFQELTMVTTFRTVISGDNADAQQVPMALVTTGVFRVLGARVVLGRDFEAADSTPGPANAPTPPAAIAILSHEFWMKRYGGDSGVLGRSIDAGGFPAQVVGVLEPGFELLLPPKAGLEKQPAIYAARRLNFANASRNDALGSVFARLKPGVSAKTATAQTEALAADLRQKFPIKQTAGLHIRVEPLQENLVADVRPAIMALMGGVVFLLLIACANVANLLLVRSAARGRELALRAALGGDRWDLVRQSLAETLLLAGSGAALGLLLAKLGIGLLISLGPKNLPRIESIEMDPLVLGFTAAAAILAAAIFGVGPALRASRPDVMEVLRASGRTAGLGGGRILRNAVVVAEVALSFVLLIGAGLMVRSFISIAQAAPGFDAEGVLTFSLPATTARGNAQRQAFMHDVRTRLQALPGVQAVSATFPLPLDGRLVAARWGTQDALADPGKFHQANIFLVLPGFFETLHTQLIEGRTFTDADNAPEVKSVIVDRLLAEKAFPHQSAVGKRLLIRVRTPEPEMFTVVGVVAHQRHEGLATDGREAYYVTDGYMGHGTASEWIVRTAGDPMRLAALVRAEIARLDKRLATGEMEPMMAYVERARAQTRFALILIGIFAAIAAILAAVGLYGVLSNSVRQRTAEIGVRMALGAAPSTIFRLVVGQGLRLSVAGIALGLVAAFALTRVMVSMLVGVKPTDPATFSAMAVAFLAIAAVACWLPARRAARLAPTSALREE